MMRSFICVRCDVHQEIPRKRGPIPQYCENCRKIVNREIWTRGNDKRRKTGATLLANVTELPALTSGGDDGNHTA